MISFILVKLYYVLNKKEDFISVNEYQENKENDEKIKNVFNLVRTRNLSFIIYFLITFTPENISMVLKYLFSYTNMKTYFINFLTIFFISFSGTFLFCIRLHDPLMRAFIINLLSFNREFISNYEKNLVKEKDMNESFISNNVSSINNGQEHEDSFIVNNNFKRNDKRPKTIALKTISFNFGNSKNNKEKNKKFGISTVFSKKACTSGNFEMYNFNESERGNLEASDKLHSLDRIGTYSNLNELEENYYLENHEYENGEIGIAKNNNSKNDSKTNSIIISEKERNDSKNNKSLFVNSFGSIDKKENINNKKNISKGRNYTIVGLNPLEKQNKIPTFSIRKGFKRSIHKKREKNFSKNQRANSTIFGFLKQRSVSRLDYRGKRSNSKVQLYHEEISPFTLMNNQLEMKDNLIRLIAISIAINECRIYDNIKEYKKFYNSTIPWENKDFYKERSLFKEYNEKTIPSWLGIKGDTGFNNIQFKILSFSPFVFHHIRLIDNISIDDVLSSLDPINNMKQINSMKVSGGRGNNCIINTWDKKIIVKTVDTTERKILIENMIIDYHCLMKESRSLLSRIYGIFKIELKDKGTINVMIQRNMNDLPLNTKLLTFDIKGSTVDRQSIRKKDENINKQELAKKYKTKVLKDKDLGILDMKFVLKNNDCQQLISCIDNDTTFLQNYEVTDYSLLVFVHKYRKEDVINNKITRIIPSKDNKYIYNFSIVDFLGTFNLEKKGEKIAKEIVGYFKKLEDTNFSVLDPNRYAKRFRSFVKRIIID